MGPSRHTPLLEAPSCCVQESPSGGMCEEDEVLIDVSPAPVRVLSLGRFVVIAFFLCCGGPFGLEEAVSAGGVVICLSGLCLLPFVWSIPQSLMTAELATMMPVNGGSLVWVFRALGHTAGIVNAYNGLATSLFDISLYPNLIVAYSPIHLSPVVAYFAKVLVLLAVSICNAIGLDIVGNISVALVILSMSVFVVEIPWAIKSFAPQPWTLLPEKGVNWALLSSVLLWCNTGWDSLGTIAGEVRSPSTTYPLGIAFALLASSCAYIGPVVVTYCLLPSPDQWDDEAFFSGARLASPLLGIWVQVASCLCNFGQLNAGIASTSRRIWAMGTHQDEEGGGVRTLPRFASVLSTKFKTPWAALSIQFTISAILVVFDFSELIQAEMCMNCCTLGLEFCAFMVLKYREPDTLRPYVVPFGLSGAWCVTGIKTIVILFLLTSMIRYNPRMVMVCIGINVFIIIFFWILRWAERIEQVVTQRTFSV